MQRAIQMMVMAAAVFFITITRLQVQKKRGWGFRADVKRRGAHLGHKVETPVSHIWSQNNTPNAVWLSYGCNLFLHPCKMVFISFWIFDLKWCLIGCSLWRSKKCSERNSFRFVVPPTAALKCYTHTHTHIRSKHCEHIMLKSGPGRQTVARVVETLFIAVFSQHGSTSPL